MLEVMMQYATSHQQMTVTMPALPTAEMWQQREESIRWHFTELLKTLQMEGEFIGSVTVLVLISVKPQYIRCSILKI